MEIPPYPEFRPLGLADKSAFDSAFRSQPPEISEYTFSNLFAWRHAYAWEVCRSGDLLLLASPRGDTRAVFEPIGSGDRRAVLDRVLTDTGQPVRRVPEATRRLFAGDPGYRLEPDRDNADYLYAVADLAELKGNKYDGKRNHIRRFRNTQAYAYLPLDASHAAACWTFHEQWCTERNCDHDLGLDTERTAVRAMVDHFADFGLLGGAIQVDGRIVAVAAGERLNPETLVMHLLKAANGFPGLYQTMLNEFLAREGKPFRFVNLEQDLGLEGLRKAKLSYHPVRLVEKFTLWPPAAA